MSFHSEVLGATYFGLVLGDCVVNAMNCIKKNQMFMEKFFLLFKIQSMIIWAMFKKLCLVFFFSSNLKICKLLKYDNLSYVWRKKLASFFSSSKAISQIVSYQESERYTVTILEKRSTCMSRIFYYSRFLNHSWREKNKGFTINEFFWKI